MSIDAMKQALEALEYIENNYMSLPSPAIKAMSALRLAIEQAEKQEPVAWLEPEWGEKICPEVGYEITMTDDHPRDLCWIPLYPHPPQNINETDEGDTQVYRSELEAAVKAEREAVIALLKGIDETEINSRDGWWETSTGADFGAGILAAIRARGEKT
jgi:hypothetical protein